MSKTYHYVYVTTNVETNKQYVGDHSTNNLNDNYLGSGIQLKASIKKYGKEKFHRKILEFFDDKSQAFDNQAKWINELDTLAPNGYNISPKGGHNVESCMAKSSREKISKSMMGKNTGPKSEETKRKISITQSGRTLSLITKQRISESAKSGMTDERKKKISEGGKGRIPWNKGKKLTNRKL